MQKLTASFREFVAREHLFRKTDKLLLACSGGLDSTVLAHLLHAEGYGFAIAHMNFQLRGEASDGDAAFVEDLARTLGAKFFVHAVDVKKEALAGESTQMTARRLRYDWFNDVMDENGFGYILTAHHLEDNFETALINLIRGTGLRGMRGMLAAMPWLARPLLNSSKASIKQYATNQNLSWREDQSNASDDYLRNQVRHHLAPIFYDQFGMNIETWAQTAANLRSAETFYNEGVLALKKDWTSDKEMFVVDRTKWSYNESNFLTFLTEVVPEHYGFSRDEYKQMITSTGTKVMEGKIGRVYITPEELMFDQGEKGAQKRLPELEIDSLPYKCEHGLRFFDLSYVERPEWLPEDQALYLAPKNLPLHLRPRKKGDRFQPLGMGGKTKKVKDYMIDEKIPVWLRDRIYLLTNDQDEIMAIPGFCISEKFKVLPEHDEVLRIYTKSTI